MIITADTALYDEIKQLQDYLGKEVNVTTNPSLMKKVADSRKRKLTSEYVKEYCMKLADLTGKRPYSISVEVNGSPDYREPLLTDRIIDEAYEINKLNKELGVPVFLVKVPGVNQGFIATYELSKSGVPVNQTLIFSKVQAEYAARSGAKKISPFVGRMNNAGLDGLELSRWILHYLKETGYPSHCLFASTRNGILAREAYKMGCHDLTAPVNVLMDELLKEELIHWMDNDISYHPEHPREIEAYDLKEMKHRMETEMSPAEKKITYKGLQRFLADALESGWHVM